MTIHYAKGTEYPVVFIVGLSDHLEIFNPCTRQIEYRFKENIDEEERRIYFVGMTRAKEKLYLAGSFEKSQIITEIGWKYIDNAETTYKSISSADLQWYDSKKDYDPKKMYEKKSTQFMIGDQVVHTTFGAGVVVEVDGDYITILFKAPYGKKVIIGSHIALKRLKN